jgi:hypothetical protein
MKPAPLATSLGLLLAALAGPTASAQGLGRWSVEAGTGASYVTDRSFDFAASSDAMPVGDLRVGYRPGWLGNHLELGLAYVGATLGATTFQAWNTSLTVHSFQPGVLYRWSFGDRLSAYGRVAGLVDTARLDLSAGEALPLYQRLWTGGALGAAGAEVIAVRGELTQIGVLAEVGYAYRPVKAHFDHLAPDVGGGSPAPVAVTPVDAGSIDLSGVQWRLSLALHL